MKSKTLRFFGVLILSPLNVFASGYNVLTSLFIDFGVFVFIMIAIVALNIKWTGKLILFLTYCASIFLLFYVTNQMSYERNLIMINISSALFPPATVYLTYKMTKDKFPRNSD